MEDVDLGVCKGRWYAGDPRRVAVVLPGARYLPFAPLLWFAREVAASRGWSVLEVWDEYVDRTGDPWQWTEDRLEAALAHVGDPQALLVTKSLTSRAARLAANRSLPGIWLTPLLYDEEIASEIARMDGPALLIGGTADESWVSDVAEASGHERLELEGADHSLQVEGRPAASLELLGRVVERIDAFLAALPSPK